LTLRRQGWSFSRIASELKIHRQTVARYVREHSEAIAAPIVSDGPKSTQAPIGSEDSKSTEAPRNSSGDSTGRSDCEPLREVIEKKLDLGLHARRIYQDLIDEHGFQGSYWSVMRFVRRLEEALANRLTHAEFLELILQDELAVRGDRQVQRRTKAAAFREVKTLDQFDFSFNPSINRQQIYGLATCRFIREARDVLWLGPPGVGKSFLVQALGYQAIKSGFLVYYRSVFDVVRDFMQDEAFGGQDKVLARYLKPDLLIIDDMGMKQLPLKSGEFLFEIIMRRYELKSTMMTSNRPLEDWGKLIGDVPAATAILDRFLHHAEVISITGKSGRTPDGKDKQAPVSDSRKRRGHPEDKQGDTA
jgi:DNA replication protein DnaC